MKRKRIGQSILLALLLALSMILSQGFSNAYAEEEKKAEEKPERLIQMAVEYPGVVVPAEEDVSMDIIFHNKGRSDENVDVRVAGIPEGWSARIKTYKFTVTSAYVPSGENKRLTFEAAPGKEVKPGEYKFDIKAETRDGQFKMDQIIVVTVKEKEEKIQETRGIKLKTQYPVLQGPSDIKYEFSLEVDSKLDKEAVFNLFAQGPEGWDVNFKPAYENKYISSVRMKANQSQTVAVEAKPPLLAQAGEYLINVRVSSDDAKGEVELKVLLKGTYGLETGTASGLLSLEARQGKTANMSIYVKNTGTATNNDIKFMSFKPENWKVEFKPENIPVLEPGDLKQVEVNIIPYEEALVGDYAVAVSVDGEKAKKDMEFRVTVKASTAWGWIGIGIIVIVVMGLTGLFRWLGRR